MAVKPFLPEPPRVVAEPAAALALAGTLGGKAWNLARLEGAGLPVPPWYALTVRGFAEALGEEGRRRIEAMLSALAATAQGPAVERAAAEIQAFVEGLEIPPDLAAEIAQAHAARIPAGAYVAVRSSALGEDAGADSFAGIHESYLFVRGEGEVLAAMRRVWASAFAPRALSYRLARGIPLAGIAVAVAVQEMVDAAVAGVLFTVDPVSGSVYHLTVSSLYGAGEGLVSVGLDADTYTVDKETLETSRRLASKSERLVRDAAAGQGLRREPVPGELREASSLSDAQLATLARFGIDLERRFGRPQDVEFAFDAAGRLFFLQARPITTLAEDGPAAGHHLIWDNSNIIESYSGVTSPMTFSFIRHAYSIVYHCFAEVMGIGPATVAANRNVFTHMLGLLRGRVYYNLFNWYRLVGLFPGFSFNKAAMESMMGVRRAASLEEEPEPPRGAWQRYTRDLPDLLRLFSRSARNFLHIRRIVGEFEAHFKRCYGRWAALDFRKLPPHELLGLYREMEEKLLWEWKAPIINDFFVMVFYGTLKKLCVSWCGDTAGSLQNDLICGEGGIESTEPTKLLLRLAGEIRKDPELAAFFAARDAVELAREVPVDPQRTALAAEIARFLDLYGFRSPDELKLEEPTLRDRPDFVYQILKNYLAMNDPTGLDVAAMEAREQGIRRGAEERAFRALREKGGLVPRRMIFRRVLGNARLGVKNRENLRFARTRIYGLLREILRAVGENFAASGLLERPEDIFYLQLFEVWDYVEGMAVTTDLKGLSALRRKEFEAYRSQPESAPADRLDTWGMVYHRNLLRGRPRPAAAHEEGKLAGIGCCPGEIEGPVVVLHSPTEGARLQGEILVALRTDPGWIPLYPAISGLLIERGSILSHSAIVAREMGIPTIVGIEGLLAAVETGRRVRMNGATGAVELVEG